MRLPFGFGRRSSSGDGAAGGGSDAGTGTNSVATPDGPTRPSRAWASLPPIQRTTGEMPLVAAPGAFAEALPGSHGLPPIVQPLGHEVSPLATPGLVVAHVRPVAAPAGGAMPAPVQRSLRRGSRSEPAQETAPTSHAEVEGALSSREPVGIGVGAAPPIRSLPTVSRLTIRMPERPLTSAEIAARPASVQRAAGGSGASTPAPVARTGMRRAAGSTSTAAAPTVSRASAAAAPVAPPTATPPAQAPEPPLRPGLGAPLDVLPSTARPVGPRQADAIVTVPVSRQIATSAMALATGGRRRTMQREVPEADGAPVAPMAQASPSTPDPRGHRPVMGDLPALPVLTLAGSRAATSATAPQLAAPPTAAPTPVVRPLVGARPIGPVIRIQQSAAAGDQETDDVVGLPSPWWAPPDTEGAASSSNGARSADVAPISVSRSIPTLAPGPTPNDRLGPATHTGLPAGAASTVRLRSVQRAATSTVALPIARPVAASSGRQAMAMVDQPAAPAPAVQRAAAAPQEIVLQTSPSSAPLASPQPVPTGGGPVVQRAESGSTPTSTGTPGRTETDLEELAQALFSRIRGLLRSELIHDREAKGLSFDNV